jgi:hypothetical protein
MSGPQDGAEEAPASSAVSEEPAEAPPPEAFGEMHKLPMLTSQYLSLLSCLTSLYYGDIVGTSEFKGDPHIRVPQCAGEWCVLVGCLKGVLVRCASFLAGVGSWCCTMCISVSLLVLERLRGHVEGSQMQSISVAVLEGCFVTFTEQWSEPVDNPWNLVVHAWNTGMSYSLITALLNLLNVRASSRHVLMLYAVTAYHQ